jgi:hypothetical protein
MAAAMLTTVPATQTHEAVPDRVTMADPTTASLAQHLVVGVIVTTLVLLVGVTLPIWIAYGNFLAAAGVGVMAAMWGGPCFGLIAGAAIHTMRTAH